MHPLIRVMSGMLWLAASACGADYFVSPSGNDSSPTGSIDDPYKTIGKAVAMAAAGDTIYLRGGQHDYSATISISKSGASGNPITLCSYQEEVPVLDFTAQPAGDNYKGIILSGSYWHLKGFVIQYAGHNGLQVPGSYNIMEQLITRSNGDTGLHLSIGASYNLVLNCDSYLNYDPEEHGQDADGFGAKGPTDDSASLGPGNAFGGCRAWNNSDDGFDFWHAGSGVTVEDCWAFRNGENVWEDPYFAGNGNGFKLGHGGGAHVLKRCIAYDHSHHGMDVNGNTTGVTVYNCTILLSGGRNFYFDEHSSLHVLRNNLSYLGSVTIYDEIDDQYNSWNGFTISDGDFASLDSTGLDGPRQADGSLPKLSFPRLSATGVAIDVGIDVGLEYLEAAPDLGAYEFVMGDCAVDGQVDLLDVECLAAYWMDSDCGTCGGADFDGDDGVDLADFQKTSSNWLR